MEKIEELRKQKQVIIGIIKDLQKFTRYLDKEIKKELENENK